MLFFFFDLLPRSSSEADWPESPLSAFDGASELVVDVGVSAGVESGGASVLVVDAGVSDGLIGVAGVTSSAVVEVARVVEDAFGDAIGDAVGDAADPCFGGRWIGVAFFTLTKIFITWSDHGRVMWFIHYCKDTYLVKKLAQVGKPFSRIAGWICFVYK